MDYSTILTKFRSCMEDIGNALRTVLGTSQKYKFTEVAAAINSCNQVYYLGTGTSFDVSGIPGYQNLTADNFIVGIGSMPYSSTGSSSAIDNNVKGRASGLTLSKSYNASTGKLTISGNGQKVYIENDDRIHQICTQSGTVYAYLVKGSIKTL